MSSQHKTERREHDRVASLLDEARAHSAATGAPPDETTIAALFRRLRFIKTTDFQWEEGRARCGDAFGTEALHEFERTLRRAAGAPPAHGEIASRVIAAYRGAADGTRRGESLALDHVLAWMTEQVPLPKVPFTKRDAAELYTDSVLALDAWTKRILHDCAPSAEVSDEGKRPHGALWKRLIDVAAVTGINERTLRRQCVRGELPAVQRTSPKATWEIDLAACRRESAGNRAAKIVWQRYHSGKRGAAPSPRAARRHVDSERDATSGAPTSKTTPSAIEEADTASLPQGRAGFLGSETPRSSVGPVADLFDAQTESRSPEALLCPNT